MAFEPKHKLTVSFDDYITRHIEWGWHTFGSPAEGRNETGPLDHIKREIVEIEDNSKDFNEWVDLIILSIDGLLRAGCHPRMVLPLMFGKQSTNMQRDWPDWKGTPVGKAIEHVRTPEEKKRKAKEGK